MRGCLGILACVLALLWGGGQYGVTPVWADGDYVTSDSALLEIEVAGEQITAPDLTPQSAPDVAPARVPVAPLDVPALIVDAARRWGIDERVMLRIAWCESRYDPQARGAAGLAGVFQFAPITWSWVAERAGYPGASPFDPRANIEAAAFLYKTEGPKHWGCK